jgi:hypothetical protein
MEMKVRETSLMCVLEVATDEEVFHPIYVLKNV